MRYMNHKIDTAYFMDDPSATLPPIIPPALTARIRRIFRKGGK